MRKVVIFLWAGCVCTACGTRQRAEQARVDRREMGSEVVRMRTAAVPGSVAELRIPVAEALRPLPEGAVFASRNRQASVRLRVLRDTLYIEAGCDSLQQLVVDYERRLARQSVAEEVRVKRTERAPLRFLLVAGLLGLLVGRAWRSE